MNLIPETLIAEPPTTDKPLASRRKNNMKPSCPPMTLEERTSNPWKVGAHVSAAGGVENAIINAAMIGYASFAPRHFFLLHHFALLLPFLPRHLINVFLIWMVQ